MGTSVRGTNILFNDSSTQGTAAFTGNRNRIINGDMRIDQRNAGASVTPTITGTVFPVDRWQCTISAGSKFSAQRNAGSVTPPAGFSNYLGATSLSAYSIGSVDYFALQHNIEGFNASDLAWGTSSAVAATLSFWVRSSLTGTFGGGLKNGAVTKRTYPFTYTISAANTWEYKTVIVSGDTSGTWPSDNTTGIAVMFGLGAGSTFSGAAGSWAGSNLVSATGATSVVGTNGATFYITGVQLEAGTVATPFERRDYGRELLMCQRYYEVGTTQMSGITYGPNGDTRGNANKFAVVKRAAPTLTFEGGGNTSVFAVASTGDGVNLSTGFSTTLTTFGFSISNLSNSVNISGVVGSSVFTWGAGSVQFYANAEI